MSPQYTYLCTCLHLYLYDILYNKPVVFPWVLWTVQANQPNTRNEFWEPWNLAGWPAAPVTIKACDWHRNGTESPASGTQCCLQIDSSRAEFHERVPSWHPLQNWLVAGKRNLCRLLCVTRVKEKGPFFFFNSISNHERKLISILLSFYDQLKMEEIKWDSPLAF